MRAEIDTNKLRGDQNGTQIQCKSINMRPWVLSWASATPVACRDVQQELRENLLERILASRVVFWESQGATGGPWNRQFENKVDINCSKRRFWMELGNGSICVDLVIWNCVDSQFMIVCSMLLLLFGCFVVLLFCCVVGLFVCWPEFCVVLCCFVLFCWYVGLLVCWYVGLLVCWFVVLLRCRVVALLLWC